MKRKLSEDTTIAIRQLADELADSSFVNQALSRYIHQLLEFVAEEYIIPQRKRIAELEHQLTVLGGRK
jgi:hypothetical protein